MCLSVSTVTRGSVVMRDSSSLLVAQVSDIHLFADASQRLLGLPTLESFQAIVAQLQALEPQPDLLLLTGDLSQDGRADAYELLQDLLSPLGIPTYWLPGNHDKAEVMAEVLVRSPFSPQKSFQAGGWHFLLLNSGVPGCVHGYLTAASLNWLERELARIGDSPTIVALHHPPFLLGSEWLDTSTLQNSEALFAVLDRYPQVKLVLFGHVHQEYACQRRQVRYLGSPSTCIQFEPGSTQFALDQQAPGFRLLRLYPDGTYFTQVERSTYCYQPNFAATGY